jgi:hypothetical protein
MELGCLGFDTTVCKVGARRTAKLCVLTPPSEPAVRLSPQRALQGLATSRDFPVIGSSCIGAARLTGDTRTSPDDLQLFVNPNVNPLAPFPMWLAFPTSEYYGTSDACSLH